MRIAVNGDRLAIGPAFEDQRAALAARQPALLGLALRAAERALSRRAPSTSPATPISRGASNASLRASRRISTKRSLRSSATSPVSRSRAACACVSAGARIRACVRARCSGIPARGRPRPRGESRARNVSRRRRCVARTRRSARCARATSASARETGRVTSLRQIPRLLRIAAVLIRYRLDDLVDAAHLYRPLQAGAAVLPRPRADIAAARAASAWSWP